MSIPAHIPPGLGGYPVPVSTDYVPPTTNPTPEHTDRNPLDGECTCHLLAPCSWCTSLDEVETEVYAAGGRPYLRALVQARETGDYGMITETGQNGRRHPVTRAVAVFPGGRIMRSTWWSMDDGSAEAELGQMIAKQRPTAPTTNPAPTPTTDPGSVPTELRGIYSLFGDPVGPGPFPALLMCAELRSDLAAREQEVARLRADLDWHTSYTHLDGGPTVARPIAEIIRERDDATARLREYERILETIPPHPTLSGPDLLRQVIGEWRQTADADGSHYRAWLAMDEARDVILSSGWPLGDDSDPELTPLRLVREVVGEVARLRDSLAVWRGALAARGREVAQLRADYDSAAVEIARLTALPTGRQRVRPETWADDCDGIEPRGDCDDVEVTRD